MTDPDKVNCQVPCPHPMLGRCPGCRREMYAPAVWVFSHGAVNCSCGYAATLKENPE